MSSSPFVILPASSRTGTQAAKLLLEQGLQVRAGARNLSKLESLKSLGAETVKADFSKLETIKSALKDAKALFVLNPPRYDESDMFEEASKVANVIIEALKESDVKRLVLLSSIGAELASGTGNIRTVHILEEALSKNFSSKIELVFLRAPYFVENWSSVAKLAIAPPYILPSLTLPIDKPFSQSSTQDIGTVAVKYLTIESTSLFSTNTPTIVELSGPKDLSVIQVAEAFEKINGGHKVNVVAVEDKDFESTLEKNFPKHVAKTYAEMLRGFNSGRIAWLKEGKAIKEFGTTEIEVTLREIAQ